MHVAAAEGFATRMLSLAPTVTVVVDAAPRPCSTAVWLGRLYGYTYSGMERYLPNTFASSVAVTLTFVRNDEPGARRRAEWMRNPAADPTYSPPVAWHVNGGPGYRLPGWHPDVRVVITPEVEASLRYNDAEFARQLPGGSRLVPPAFASRPLPPLPPPPPPPNVTGQDGRQRP
ncbi:hypothetical protein [Streptacidiphilus jiangxiensis]|uniref:Uncharacterized protein n=1 Tax=Streptacidiphilus jiangxiensis TaxID=235985 RepID=A0A1H7FCC8_STRJI|nr:hypothetical protein [Streptacidiphilus jiangxiensis]SEK23766.1 hypothetical protein SAMN05414137_101195 [Streptacidiphilus jiangxiensis]